MGVTRKVTSAPLVGEPQELLRHLVSLRDGDILLLDKIHRLPDRVAETLYEAMEDDRGLGCVEREYLEILRLAGRPLGLGTLADRLGKTRNTLETVHEPFLIRQRLIVRTPRGWCLLLDVGAGRSR